MGDSKERSAAKAAIDELVRLAALEWEGHSGGSSRSDDADFVVAALGYDDDLTDEYRRLLRGVLDFDCPLKTEDRKAALRKRYERRRHAAELLGSEESPKQPRSDHAARKVARAFELHGRKLAEVLRQHPEVIARCDLAAEFMDADCQPVSGYWLLAALDGFGPAIDFLATRPSLKTTKVGYLLFKDTAARVYGMHCNVLAAVMVVRPWEALPGREDVFDEDQCVVHEEFLVDLVPHLEEQCTAAWPRVVECVADAMPAGERPGSTVLNEYKAKPPRADSQVRLHTARRASQAGWEGIDTSRWHGGPLGMQSVRDWGLLNLCLMLARGGREPAKSRARETWERIRASSVVGEAGSSVD